MVQAALKEDALMAQVVSGLQANTGLAGCFVTKLVFEFNFSLLWISWGLVCCFDECGQDFTCSGFHLSSHCSGVDRLLTKSLSVMVKKRHRLMGILMAWASRGVNASVADHLFKMSQPKFTMIYPFLLRGLILKCSCFSFFPLLMHLLARKGAGSSSSWSSAVEDQFALHGKRCFLVQFCLIAFTVRRLKQVSNLIRSTLYAFGVHRGS